MHVVTTSHRGVFAGTVKDNGKGNYLIIKNARMCVYWSAETRGVTGLASTGPQKGSRITKATPELKIPRSQVTAIMSCTTEAVARWEAEPWN